jgi:predicted component of type VI protein secretion system
MKWAVHRHFHDIDAMRKALRRALDSHESRVWKMKTKAWRSAKEKTGANLSIERMLTRAQAARTMKLMRSGRLV